MLTIVSYIGFMCVSLAMALTLFIGLSKVRLI